tara:strand:+ start:163 stop:459 length:297 start_codon:yes stop_codon:yes gene_type:complete
VEFFPTRELGKIRLGICTIGSSGGDRKHKVRFSSSLEIIQQLSLLEGMYFIFDNLDHSSLSKDAQPFSVRRILAPLEPAGRSLETNPSSLKRLISAET